MSAGRFAVYCSAYYGRQAKWLASPVPVVRLDSSAQAVKRAGQEVGRNPGSVALVIGPGTRFAVGPDGRALQVVLSAS